MNTEKQILKEEKGETVLDDTIVTLGTDFNKKFAWCLRKVNGVKCIALHKRVKGFSYFSEKDFITAIPVEIVAEVLKKYSL